MKYEIGLILSLLKDEEVRSGRYLHAKLFHENRADPQTVTNALKFLREHPDIPVVKNDFPNGYGGGPCYAYSIGQPSARALDRLAEGHQLLSRIATKKALRTAGEEYVRSLLLGSGRFSSVTQRQRLGLAGSRAARDTVDLMATDLVSHERFGISVKNQHEILFPGKPLIKDCKARADAHNATPWLFVPFATSATEARCARDGIRLTLLDRQLLPAETWNNRIMRDVIEDFREDIIGPLPLDFVYVRFAETLARSPLAQRDLERLYDDRIIVAC
jgi:hypothetical protein